MWERWQRAKEVSRRRTVTIPKKGDSSDLSTSCNGKDVLLHLQQQRENGWIPMWYSQRIKAGTLTWSAQAVLVNLSKAYDSVTCAATWRVLEKYGSPQWRPVWSGLFVRACQPSWESMAKPSREKAACLAGYRQGCTMAPVLFNIGFQFGCGNLPWAAQGKQHNSRAYGCLVGLRSSKHSKTKLQTTSITLQNQGIS